MNSSERTQTLIGIGGLAGNEDLADDAKVYLDGRARQRAHTRMYVRKYLCGRLFTTATVRLARKGEYERGSISDHTFLSERTKQRKKAEFFANS